MARVRLCAVAVVAVGALVVAPANSANAACVDAACAGIPANKQQVAQLLVAQKNAGQLSFAIYPDIFTREILPIAEGRVEPQCDVDIRSLQTVAMVVNKFGSAVVTDLNRFCSGDPDATCGTSPTHCVLPSIGVDFGRVGGRAPCDVIPDLLSFIATFAPSGTYKENNCGNLNGYGLTPFNAGNASHHQHIDFRGTDMPLNIPGSGSVGLEPGGLNLVGVANNTWQEWGTGLVINPKAMSAVFLGSGNPRLVFSEGGTLRIASPEANGWQLQNSGFPLDATSLSALPQTNEPRWPMVMAVENGTLIQVWGDTNGWHKMSTGIPISGKISATLGVVPNSSAPNVMVSEGGILYHVFVSGGKWVKISTGQQVGDEFGAADITGYPVPQVMTLLGGKLQQIYGDSGGWHRQSTPTNASGQIAVVNMGGGAPQVILNENGWLSQIDPTNGWQKMSIGKTGSARISAANVGQPWPQILKVG